MSKILHKITLIYNPKCVAKLNIKSQQTIDKLKSNT